MSYKGSDIRILIELGTNTDKWAGDDFADVSETVRNRHDVLGARSKSNWKGGLTRYGKEPLGGRVERIERGERPAEKVWPFDGLIPFTPKRRYGRNKG